MPFLADESVQLVVTSPPYPMIQMWDQAFSGMSAAAARALASSDGPTAFNHMHDELDRVWRECWRVLAPGGFLCINIGDATRTVGSVFRLYSNHARILQALGTIGFVTLPDILWRKPTNAPNKFMGSGMLPAGAYVTYEHEYILIARKGGLRKFRDAPARQRRAMSAYFWEERNLWFSDLWDDLRGSRQKMPRSAARDRSASFPLALAHRLVCMFSVYGDVVLDPFAGTGTTAAAAIAAGRSSVSVDCEPTLQEAFDAAVQAAVPLGRRIRDGRLQAHQDFVNTRIASGRTLKYINQPHHMPVITRQEVALALLAPVAVMPMATEGDGDASHVAYTATHALSG